MTPPQLEDGQGDTQVAAGEVLNPTIQQVTHQSDLLIRTVDGGGDTLFQIGIKPRGITKNL